MESAGDTSAVTATSEPSGGTPRSTGGKPKTGDHTLALLAVSASLAVGSGVLCLLCRGDVYKRQAAICAHTNLDMAQGGVNTCLAERLQLKQVRMLKEYEHSGLPEGRCV